MLERQDLGEIYFVTSTRVNLGIHQSNSSVIQDLAPHDFSILHYWLGMPLFVRAIGRDSVVRGDWDVAFIDMGYPTGTLVQMELSWLAPTKLRRTVVAGRKGMLVYDDTSNEPIRIHDLGVEVVEPLNFGEHQMAYRTGDIISPRLAADEPAARPHRRLLQRAQAGCRLAGVPHAHARPAASTNAAGSVAMPDRWPRKLSAVRSAVRTDASGPRPRAEHCPAATDAPSSTCHVHSMAGST